jgi:acyl-CoA dehydrogenase
MLPFGAAIPGLPGDVASACTRLTAFLHDELRPAEREHRIRDDADASPDLRRWVRRRSSELGLYRLLQPADTGGGGLGPLASVALHEVVGASATVLGRLALGGDGGLLRLATGEQRERLLLPLLRGELEAGIAFTDARDRARTTAVRRGDAFAVSGVKSFVSGGATADVLITVARVVENDGGPTGTALLVVRHGAPGLTVLREKRTLDGTTHVEIELREVLVPSRDVLGQIGQGLAGALAGIARFRLEIAALACGLADWALALAVTSTDRPHRSGVPLAEREQVQAMLGESLSDLYAARAATYAAAREAEHGNGDVETTMAKTIATEALTRIVDRAIQLIGGAAVVEDHPLALAYRRIRGWRIAEGSTEVLRLSIARDVLARHRAAKRPAG